MPSAKSILVDAGPLIALGTPSDKHHAEALEFARTCEAQLVTTWAVVAETAHFIVRNRTRLYRRIEAGMILVEDLGPADMPRLIEILEKYPQADLADASLVLVGERLSLFDIATTDKKDFAIYRTKSGKYFRNLFGIA